MSNSESLSHEQNNSKSKTQLTYEVLTQLQESIDAFGIARQEKAYGALLRISVQNKAQLQNIIDIMELILVTKDINIVEVIFPHGDNKLKKNGFMLYIKGSPHHAIKSIFNKTDSNWKIMAVEYKQSDNNSTVTSNGGNGNGTHRYFNGTNTNNDQFFETQYEIIVQNTMKRMRIDREEAENHIYLWWSWKCQPNLNISFADYKHQEQKGQRTRSPANSTFANETKQTLQDGDNKNYKESKQPETKHKNQRSERNAEKNGNTISEVKNSLTQADMLFDKTREREPKHSQGSQTGEVSTPFIARNENQIGLLPDGQRDCVFACLMFCLKSLILLSLSILLYILYTNENTILVDEFSKHSA